MLARLGGRTFASLRHRNFRLYYASHAVAFAGRWMQQIATYWLVLELTGSAVAVGALALVQLLPVTLFGRRGELYQHDLPPVLLTLAIYPQLDGAAAPVGFDYARLEV